MDHRLPVSRGGEAGTENLAICCPPCNGAKGPLTEQEFRSLLSLIWTWEDQGKALLIRLRGGFWNHGQGGGKGRPKGCPGREVSQEEREAISLRLTGIKRSEETRRKMSEAQKGKVLSPEALANVTAANRRPISEETRQKLREAKLGPKNPWFGKDLIQIREGLQRDPVTGQMLPKDTPTNH